MSEKKISFWHPASLICTCMGAGKISFAPGTWGSLVGLAYFYLQTTIYNAADSFFPLGYKFYYGFADMLVWLAIGLYCCKIYEAKSEEHDASEIVIDEFVGQYLTCIIAIWGFVDFLNIPINNNLALAVCFVFFRIFDIVKRGPVGWIDRNIKGGKGVMFDDVVAGILAGLTSGLVFILL